MYEVFNKKNRAKGEREEKIKAIAPSFCILYGKAIGKGQKGQLSIFEDFSFFNCFFSGLKSQNFEKLLKQKFFLIR